MPDAQLTAALKQAKATKMFFAFIPKGGSDGQLIVSKTKIPAKEIADAKKQIGGGNAVTGKCFGGEGGAMVFQVAKAASPAMAAAVKKVAKRDSGLTIDADFQLAGDADADEQDTAVSVALAPPSRTSQEDDGDDDAQGIGQEAEAAEEEADAAALQTKAAADKAQIMQRLTALVAPYKEAVANNNPNAQRLQALLATVKTSIAQKQFTQAGEGLDMLKDLLAEKSTPLPDVAGQDDKEDEDDSKQAGLEDGANAEVEDDSDQDDETGAGDDGDDQTAAPLDYAGWKAAKLNGISVAKALAVQVAAAKHQLAAGVLGEINSILGFIKKLPDNPPPEQIDKIVISIDQHEAIADAEAAPAHIAGKVDIKGQLLNALKGLRG
jgi:hypothetical protein